MIPDEYFARADHHIPRHIRERVHAIWRSAQRYQFSVAASTVAGRLRHEAPALIIKHREFAIPPFKTMYVEADSTAFMKDTPTSAHFRDQPADKRLGYLVDGNDVYVFAGGDPGESAMTPWFYRFGESDDTLWAKSDQRDWQFLKLAVLLGGGANTVFAQSIQDEITGSVALKAMIDIRRIENFNKLTRMLSGSLGDICNLWCFLLWLNQPKRISYLDIPPQRRILRGKLSTYSAFRTVNIDLGKHRSITRAFLIGADRTPSRRHWVSGSFHHHGGLREGCGHDYVALHEQQLWECRNCQRRRWWVREHERGDLSRGRVVHDYSITAGD